MDSCDALLSALDAFDGTVIIVTHNEMFLHALADRLIVFQNEQIHLFEGSYQQFLNDEGWIEEADEKKDVAGFSKDIPDSLKRTKKNIRKIRSEIIVEKSRRVKPLEVQIKKIEEDIDILEKNVNTLNEDMISASQSNDGKRIAEVSQRIHKDQTTIDSLFTEMEKLYHDKDLAESYFENKLGEIE